MVFLFLISTDSKVHPQLSVYAFTKCAHIINYSAFSWWWQIFKWESSHGWILRNPFTYHRTVMFGMNVCVLLFFSSISFKFVWLPFYSIAMQWSDIIHTLWIKWSRSTVEERHAETWERKLTEAFINTKGRPIKSKSNAMLE